MNVFTALKGSHFWFLFNLRGGHQTGFSIQMQTCPDHRRLKFYVLTHNNPKNLEYLTAISLLQVRHLSIFDNFWAQLCPDHQKLSIIMVINSKVNMSMSCNMCRWFLSGFSLHPWKEYSHFISFFTSIKTDLTKICHIRIKIECIIISPLKSSMHANLFSPDQSEDPGGWYNNSLLSEYLETLDFCRSLTFKLKIFISSAWLVCWLRSNWKVIYHVVIALPRPRGSFGV